MEEIGPPQGDGRDGGGKGSSGAGGAGVEEGVPKKVRKSRQSPDHAVIWVLTAPKTAASLSESYAGATSYPLKARHTT